MALVEIIDVAWFDQDPNVVLGANLDAPTVGTISETYAFEIGGWILTRESPAQCVEFVHENRALRKVRLAERRTDVAEKFPEIAAASECGFWAAIGVAGMPAEFEVLVQAVLGEGTRVLLATVRGRHEPIRSGFEPTVQPLMVTSWGRTGSTLLMKILLSQENIVGFREYPYETRVAAYWMHLLKVLAEPANHQESSHPDNFTEDLQWIGHLPFYTEPPTTNPPLKQWLGRSYVEETAAFCQQSIDGFYQRLALGQGQKAVIYFAEKSHPIHTSWLLWELYPEAREIFLVRDFRDTICSMLAFNAKRGFPSFGSERCSSTEDFLELQKLGATCFLESWRRRRGKAFLVRYEDLVLRPLETLGQMFHYLGLEPASEFLERVIRSAFLESTELQQHRTSADAQVSIGRWQHELAPAVQAACERMFAEVLGEFGYSSQS